MNLKEIKNYHFYATANDDSNFFYDIKNFLRLRKRKTGVGKLVLLVAISEAKKITIKQRLFVFMLKLFFSKKRKFEIKSVFFKSNVGRDFSSYFKMFNVIKDELNDEDYIFFQNRSAYGPFQDDWYLKFIKQIHKKEDLALCGSTISFRDHPNRSERIDLPHVQTYSFFTTGKYLKMISDNFPGVKATSRIEAIYNGEIEFSQFYLRKGYGIICMEWPNNFIYERTKPIKENDIRGNVKENHQFYHRGFFEQTEGQKRGKFKVFKILIIFFIKSFFTKL